MKQETLEEVLKKIKSTKLCLMAHPDNEVHSEFADRITDLEDIEIELLKTKSQQGYSEEDMKRAFCNGGQLDYSALKSTQFGTKLLNKWFEQFKKK